MAGEHEPRLSPKDRKFPRPKKFSRQVDPGSNPLARATQLARHSDKSYGGVRKDGKWESNNYAAAHVRGADHTGDFIIVGRSKPRGRHSERNIGTPFLRQNEAHRVVHMYSERAPCVKPSNCSAWLAEKFKNTRVTYSIPYSGDSRSPDSARERNLMREYLEGLRAAA